VSTSVSAAATTPLSARRAWELVLRHIEGDLLSGALKPGDHLPPERALAAELGVGRSSVREAIRVLEVLGLVRTQSGSGPQSGAVIIARPSGGMAALLRLQVAAQGFVVRDIVKTRLVMEAAVVAELASSPTPPDLSTPLDLLEAMEHPTSGELSFDEFLTLDQAFHRALADASGNEVIAAMMGGLRDSIEDYVRAGARFLPSWQTTSERLKREHRAIVAAIDARDPELASTRIRDHIEAYHAETNAYGSAPAPGHAASGHAAPGHAASGYPASSAPRPATALPAATDAPAEQTR
jgi:DNA-binding FadR family transcriptional regulator